MKRTTAALILAASVGLGTYSCSRHNDKYSPEKTWDHAKARIEQRFPLEKDRPKKNTYYDEVKKGIADLEARKASKEDRCRFETKMLAKISVDDEKKAEENIAHASFEPYAHCKPGAQTLHSLGDWTTVLSGIMLLIGSIGIIASFRKSTP